MTVSAERDSLVEAYVERLQRAYTLLRRRWHPGYRGPGLANARWYNCANFLFSHKADPFQFMQYVFNRFIPKAGDVYVTFATSTNIARDFLKELPRLRESANRRVYLQAEALNVRLKNGETLDSVLMDPYAELTSVFRFAAAWSVGRKDLAEKFRQPAQQMLLFEPYYAELLGQWLPADMVVGLREGA